MRSNQKFRLTQNIETDQSILWHGKFSVFILTQLKETTYTHIQLTEEIKEIQMDR